MSIATDLLKQAGKLLYLEPRKPKLTSLRRAVSTAYYAMFHLLVDDGVIVLLGNASSTSSARLIVSRSFDHINMKEVCKVIANQSFPNNEQYKRVFDKSNWNRNHPPCSDLQLIASVFMELQEARHNADYEPENILQNTGQSNIPFDRQQVGILIDNVKDAFDKWENLKKHHIKDLRTFLALMLLKKNMRGI